MHLNYKERKTGYSCFGLRTNFVSPLSPVKKLINDFSGTCFTLPVVFSPYCHHPETALLLLESDLQQSTLVQLQLNKTFYIFSPILSAKLPINCFHSPSHNPVLFHLSNLSFNTSMFLLTYVLYVLSVT